MPDTAKMAIALAVVAAIGMVFMGPVQTAVTANSGDVTVTNESVTAVHGEYVDLGGYDVAEDSETVYYPNETSGGYDVGTEGSDYELATANGSIKALSSGEIGDADAMKVTYTYQASGEIATTVMSFLPVMLAVLVFVGIARPVIDGVDV